MGSGRLRRALEAVDSWALPQSYCCHISVSRIWSFTLSGCSLWSTLLWWSHCLHAAFRIPLRRSAAHVVVEEGLFVAL